jgi:cytochrome c oxidase subunit 1
MSSTTESAPSWHRGRVAGWILSGDHKRLGVQYLGWAGVFFVIAGILTVLMRLQLTRPDSSFLGKSTYAGMTTMHGTLLVFFVLVPVVVGLATYLVPLMIGANRIAKPSLASISLWLFVFGGACIVLSAFAEGGSSKAGWEGLPPASITQAGHGVHLWLMGMLLLALSLIGSAWNLAETIQNLRADGMTWARTPLFVWTVGIWAWTSLVLVPLAAIGLLLILLERDHPGSFDFFLSGDDSLKGWWSWLYGQTFAYIALVPVAGMIAEIVAVFAGKAVTNAKVMLQSLAAFAGLSILLALYHAYSVAVGKPSVVLVILALVITAASAVAFALLALTLVQADAVRWSAPLLFAGGAVVLFAIGVLSAIFLAFFANDRHLRGTVFGSAHAHYLIWGTSLLALLGALVYWWPKLFGRLLDERMASASAVLLFIGFNCAFFPQFLLGDKGQAEGAASFSGHGSTEAYNVISTIGAFASGLALIAFLVAVAKSRTGRRVDNDPWRADTLEWYTTSPPPARNFESLPPIESARPLRDLRERLKERNAL